MTDRTEKVVGIAHKLYEARRTLRALRGDEEYTSRVVGWRDMIRDAATEAGKPPLVIATAMLKAADARGDGGAMLWTCAGLVELLEQEGDRSLIGVDLG